MIRTKRPLQMKKIYGINITPFTDVCLVLLIIFMVTAPSLIEKDRESSHNIKLPKATMTDALALSPLIVYIKRGPQIFINKTPVTFETMAAEIEKYPKGTDGSLTMVVKAEETVPYYLVIKTIDVARNAGVTETKLATRVLPKPGVAPATGE